LGRGFVRADEDWGSHRVAVLSAGLWQRRFGGDPSAVGRTVMINGEPHTIVGVLARTFSFLNTDAQLYLPLAFAPGDNLNSHNNYFLRMIGRLRTGVSREQAVLGLHPHPTDILATEAREAGPAWT